MAGTKHAAQRRVDENYTNSKYTMSSDFKAGVFIGAVAVLLAVEFCWALGVSL